MARKSKTKSKGKTPHPDKVLEGLEESLPTGLPPLVVLYGAERWYRRQALARVLAAAEERGDEICRHDLNDPEYELGRLLDDLIGGALFAGSRCVVIDNADSLVKPRGKKYSKEVVEAIEARVEGADGSVVIVGEALTSEHRLVKRARQEGGLALSFRRLWDSPSTWDPDPRKTEVVRWIVARAKGRGLKLTPEQGATLVAAVGSDLANLSMRIDQARAEGGDLRAVLTWDAAGSPWEVAGYLVDGDANRAVYGIESLFRGGFEGKDGTRSRDPGALVAMLSLAVTGKLREVVLANEAGGDPGRAGGGPQAKAALAARLSARPQALWRRMLDDAAALERRSRSGATVDAADFCRLALRWARGRGRGRRR